MNPRDLTRRAAPSGRQAREDLDYLRQGSALGDRLVRPGGQGPGEVRYGAQHAHRRLGPALLHRAHDVRAVPVGEHQVHHRQVERTRLGHQPQGLLDGGGVAEGRPPEEAPGEALAERELEGLREEGVVFDYQDERHATFVTRSSPGLTPGDARGCGLPGRGEGWTTPYDINSTS